MDSVDPVVVLPIDIEHQRLPRGPHRLTREEVENSQRTRLLIGAAEAVAEKGYASTSVADILSRAGVSRTTFYQLFTDKADCFLAANRMASDLLSTVMAESLASLEDGSHRSSLERLDHLLAAYLKTLDDFPALARVFLVEVYAAGAEAIRQRRDALAGFVDLVEAILRSDGILESADGPTDSDESSGYGGQTSSHEPTGDGGTALISDERVVAEVLVAAVSSMVTNAAGVGDTEHLRDLHGPLMSLATRVLAPA